MRVTTSNKYEKNQSIIAGLDHPPLLQMVLDTLEAHKGVEVLTVPLAGLSDIADHMVVSTGQSSRHVQTLANYTVEASKKAGVQPIGVEGLEKGEWVLVDLGDIIVHLMLGPIREYYGLERLWGPEIRALKNGHLPPHMPSGGA